MKKTAKRIFAMLLALSMVFALAACGKDSGGPAATGNVETKSLRVGLDGEPSKLDYADPGGSYASMFVNQAIFTTLWTYTTDKQFHYLLAESYEYSADGKSLIVKIHKDAKFANGDPLKASDVLFSFKSAEEVNGMRTGSVDFDNTKVIDDTTVQIGLKSKIATQIEDFAMIPIASESWTENRKNEDHTFVNPLSSGPYYLKDGWATGKNMVLTKNPYYWNKDNLLYDTIELYFIAEENTRYLEFKTGGIDLCILQDSRNIDEVKAGSEFDLYQSPVQLNVGLIMDTNTQPTFENQDLRLAICYAVDVKTIVSTICGSAYIPATSMLPSSSWAYKNTEYGYDPVKAKEYYEKSGVKNFKWTLTVNESPLNKTVAEAIQGYLADIGITMDINVVDMPTFFASMSAGKLDSTITQYSGSSDPGSILNSWLSWQPGNLNKTPAGIQELLDEACQSTASQDERKQMFAEVQDKVKAAGKILPLYEMTCNYAQAEGVDCSKSVQADGYLTPTFMTK